jgi:phage replication-related protein YjqB (UPF0714/DUF867 family)
MADRYRSFAELSAAERRGRDYNIVVREVPRSPVAIVAPHAGAIERGASEIAVTIAGADFNLYLFEGIGPDAYRLHITSSRFDEPECLALVAACSIVVTVHGCHYADHDETVYLGGRDAERRDAIGSALRAAGFKAKTDTRNPGRSRLNICNRGSTGKGVQLEISRDLRRRLRRDHDRRAAFAEAVRGATGVGPPSVRLR